MANSYYAIQTRIRDVINDVHTAKSISCRGRSVVRNGAN